MTNLKEARKQELKKFIEEHEADPISDLDKLDALIKFPYGETAKPDRATLNRAGFAGG